MFRRTTWILLALFAIVFALTWYLEWSPAGKTRKPTPTTEVQVRVLGDWNIADTVHLEYKNEKGEVLLLEKSKEGIWSLPSNPEIQLGQGKVLQALTELSGITIVNSLSSDISLDATGLANPARKIILESSSEKKTVILAGNMTATQIGYYLKIDDKAPVVVNKYGLDSIFSMLSTGNLIADTPQPPELTLIPPGPSPKETVSP